MTHTPDFPLRKLQTFFLSTSLQTVEAVFLSLLPPPQTSLRLQSQSRKKKEEEEEEERPPPAQEAISPQTAIPAEKVQGFNFSRRAKVWETSMGVLRRRRLSGRPRWKEEDRRSRVWGGYRLLRKREREKERGCSERSAKRGQLHGNVKEPFLLNLEILIRKN